MQRDKGHLFDILEAARLAISYVEDKSPETFLKDTQCQDAVIRRLEIIGEASRRLSDETRQSLTEVPWREIIGMRNMLIHDYDDIDMKIVWDTVSEHLEPLIKILDKVVS
jgi:uncharacterized protein with HEPN domain